MSEASYRVVVSGRVQGVFYRASTQQKANELGVTGWVRNRPDGRVEAQVEGPQEAVNEMVSWMRDGPSAATVEDIETEPVEPENREGFDVV